MKNFIKKTIGALVMAMVFVAPLAAFSATLNSDPQDFATLRVANKTTNPAGSTTAWASSASASEGQVVSFAIYYHTTSSDTANNVRVRLTPQSTGSGTNHSFTATVTADNASSVTGSATVYLNSSQSLSYIPGSVNWYPNQRLTTTSLLYGQNGAELFNGTGLNLGPITTGWPSQGSVTVSFQVSSTGGPIGGTPYVTTNSATNISTNSATLNGYVNSNGVSSNVWFEWGTASSYFGNSTPQISYGTQSANFSSTIYNLYPNTTYYYRAVAQNPQGGIVYGNQQNFTTIGSSYPYPYPSGSLPIVSTNNANVYNDYATLNGYVDPRGTSDTTRWFEWGQTTNLGNSTSYANQGTSASNSSATLTGLMTNTTYYFRIVARNSQGTVYGNTLSFTTSYGGSQYPTGGIAPVVSTLLATELTGNTAKLNGLVFASQNQSSNAWFEWGTTTGLGYKTQTANIGSLPSYKHSDIISGLSNGQTYYYRAVAENSNGKAYGTIVSFVAQTQYTPVVVTPTYKASTVYKKVTTVTTGEGVSSLVLLTIDGGSETIARGEQRSYHVKWENKSTQTLKNVVLRVAFPQQMTVRSTDKGSISPSDNSVAIELGTLAPGDDGDIFVTAISSRSLNQGELVIVTAHMVYTTAKNIQGDAVAYVTQHGSYAQNVLGASIFDSGAFLPATLYGWLLLLILLLVLILLGNTLYGRMTVKRL